MKKLLLIVLLSMSASQVFASGACPSWGCNGELPISRALPLGKCVTQSNGMVVCQG